VGETLEEEGVTTTGGWITHRLGGFPKPGDVLQEDTCTLTVVDMDGVRVKRVRVTLRPRPPATA